MSVPENIDRATILVIDPDPLTLTGIAALLHYGGNECICARDGEAAWKAVNRFSPDLVVCDLAVKPNGLDLVRAISSEPGMENVSIIVLGDDDGSTIVDQIHEAGGSYFVRKPLDPHVLVELVDKLLWMAPASGPPLQTVPKPKGAKDARKSTETDVQGSGKRSRS